MLSNAKQLASLQLSCQKSYESSKNLCSKHTMFEKNATSIGRTEAASDIKMNLLAPCFRDLLKNENLPYLRYDLSFDDDLTKLINTTNEATNPRAGLFLKSLNKNVLSKNANKDSWSIEFESMWIDFCGSAFSPNAAAGATSTNTSASQTNDNCSLIQNTTFKIHLVNVWNFYKSCPAAISADTDSTPSDVDYLKSGSLKKDSFDLVLSNGMCDSIELESLINNSNYFHQENVDRAFSRLTNVIKINEIVKCNLTSKSKSSTDDCKKKKTFFFQNGIN